MKKSEKQKNQRKAKKFRTQSNGSENGIILEIVVHFKIASTF